MSVSTSRALSQPVFAAAVGASLLILFLPGSDVPTSVPVSDKVVHGGMFLLLYVTGRWAGLPAVSLAVELVVYAVASEILQTVLPIARDGDVWDAVADCCGIALGFVLVRLFITAGGRAQKR